jgi:hypothetical protein
MRFLISGPIPWLLPGLIVSLVIGLVTARWVGRRLEVHPAVAVLLALGLGLVLAATLTPLRDALEDGAIGPGFCETSRFVPIPPWRWLRLSDPTLNIAMFVPLGVAIGIVPPSRLKAGLIIGALCLPFAIELIQMAAPILARGCEAADVVDNLTGLVFGLLVGSLLGWIGVGRAQPGPDLGDGPARDAGAFGA